VNKETSVKMSVAEEIIARNYDFLPPRSREGLEILFVPILRIAIIQMELVLVVLKEDVTAAISVRTQALRATIASETGADTAVSPQNLPYGVQQTALPQYARVKALTRALKRMKLLLLNVSPGSIPCPEIQCLILLRPAGVLPTEGGEAAGR
jgi:hypothetical protein